MNRRTVGGEKQARGFLKGGRGGDFPTQVARGHSIRKGTVRSEKSDFQEGKLKKKKASLKRLQKEL